VGPRRVILDDEEVSSDEDEPLQKRLWQLSGAGSVVLSEAAAMMVVADKEAANKRVAEEAAVKRVVEERAVEEATAKVAIVGGSPAPGQVPSVARAKRAAALSGSTPPAKHPYRGVWKPRFVPLLFFVGLHSLITLFAQVLSLRRGHRNGHCYRRCGYRGDSRAGS
jgi:hypothetical protein